MPHKKLKIILSMVVSIFVVLVVAVVGGIWYMNNKFNQDMIRIANSQQAKETYKEGLKNLDKNAFTSKGVIKNYKIKEKSISHNPMGGIDVDLIINEDNKLVAYTHIDSTNNGKTLDGDGGGCSKELGNLLDKNGEKQ